jgi:hypothetical protein
VLSNIEFGRQRFTLAAGRSTFVGVDAAAASSECGVMTATGYRRAFDGTVRVFLAEALILPSG